MNAIKRHSDAGRTLATLYNGDDFMPRSKKDPASQSEPSGSSGNEEYTSCPSCDSFFKNKQSLGAHMTNVHSGKKQQQPDDETNMGETQEGILKKYMKNGGVPPGLIDLITDVYFAGDISDLLALNRSMIKGGIQANRRGMIIEAWANSQGLIMPEELNPLIESNKRAQGVQQEKKPEESDDMMFDMSVMKKTMKTMFEMQQYKAMMDFFRGFTVNPNPMPIPQGQNSQIPYMDPRTGELKMMDIKPGMDPTAAMMMFMMNQNQKGKDKEDDLETLMRVEKFKKLMGMGGGQENSAISDLKMEMLKVQTSADKKTTDEKHKFDTWMNEFKHILEKSKMENELNNKIDKLSQEIQNSRGQGDFAAEISKYRELKDALLTFAKDEGLKGGGSTGNINWQELVSKGIGAISDVAQAAAASGGARPPIRQVQSMPEVPESEEEMRRRLQLEEQNKHQFDDPAYDFVGVKFDPRTMQPYDPNRPINLDEDKDNNAGSGSN